MSPIDFRTKINWHRRFRSPQGDKSEHEILRIFESDRGRIINSPAIRRLQQKTQVFPLERNAAVRARRIYAQLSNLCEDARTRYMDSGEEIAALAADLSTGLSRLQDAFAEVQVIFDDAQNAFDDMQLPETAAEETAE